MAVEKNKLDIVDLLLTQPRIMIYSDTFREIKFIRDINIQSPMTVIEGWSFYGCLSLTHILLPPSIMFIGEFAFFGCKSLSVLSIPPTLQSIGDFAFAGCSSLKKIVISDDESSLTSLGNSSFKCCSSLEEITIPFLVSKIGRNCFEGCTKLKHVELPPLIDEIGFNLFKGCSSLTDITIPQNITKICSFSFEGCTSLKTLMIPTSVKEIGSYSFNNCTSLTEITIPTSVTSMGESVFSRCSSLTKFVIPSSITRIENCTFKGCSSLNDVIIPPSVKYIGNDVFNGCNSLTDISVPDSVIKIGTKSFGFTSPMTEIKLQPTTASENPFSQSIDVKYINNNQFKKYHHYDDESLFSDDSDDRDEEEEEESLFSDDNDYDDDDEFVGHGSFSYIRAIINKGTKEKLVAKSIREFKNNFNEIKIRMCIDHPTIIKYFGFSLQDTLTIFMAKAKNDIRNYIKDTLNNTQKQIILIGTACGMKYLHDCDMIHRDISISNILIDKSYHPLITGLFLSYFEGDKLDDITVGTLIHMAPEIFIKNEYGKKADVYSFGMLMFEIITGYNPFSHFSHQNILYKVVLEKCRPEFPPSFNNSLRNLISRCWDDDPNNRPTFNEIFNDIAYNSDFYLDGVDDQQIREYIDKIT